MRIFHIFRTVGRSSRESISKKFSSEPNISGITEQSKDIFEDNKSADSKIFIKPQIKDNQKDSRKRFKEIRQKLQNDDEEYHTGTVTPPNSQTSSVDGIPISSKTIQPFRIIEPDTLSLQSINSLGRIGRILGGFSDAGKNIVFIIYVKIIIVIYEQAQLVIVSTKT